MYLEQLSFLHIICFLRHLWHLLSLSITDSLCREVSFLKVGHLDKDCMAWPCLSTCSSEHTGHSWQSERPAKVCLLDVWALLSLLISSLAIPKYLVICSNHQVLLFVSTSVVCIQLNSEIASRIGVSGLTSFFNASSNIA